MAVNLKNNFLQYIEKNQMIGENDKVLVAVSGGVDSMVLLDLLVVCGFNVGVAHCNFKLRDKESDEDEVLVGEIAAKHKIPIHQKGFDTLGEMERSGDSMEMAARRLRYEWFNELCAAEGYNSIAIAHHADDSIETFFINLFRGTGLRGLLGIKKRWGKIIRPLSFATRKTILDYASQNSIPFREDSSNRSTKYLRNKIRLGLIPQIREISPSFTTTMMANLARLDDAQSFVSSAIEKIAEQAITKEADIDRLSICLIDKAYPLNYVIYELLSSRYAFKGDTCDDLTRSLLSQSNSSGKRFYSKEFVAYIDRGDILITRIAEEDSCQVSISSDDGRAYCGNSALYFERIDIDLIDNLDLGANVALIDEDKIKYPLTLRRWQDGDSFVPLGMDGTKKVSDLLIDQKVSLAEKQRQFVLLSDEQIIWVVGRRLDERFALDEESENVLKITKELI